MKNFLIILIVCLSCATLWSQNPEEKDNTFFISAQLRARGEYRNGALFPFDMDDQPAYFINNRARLTLGYERSNLEMRISAQHVGVWGQDPQIDKNGRLILNEAWAKMKFGKNLFFAQLGRFALAYDDERILGGLDWNVAGRYHDALRLGYETKEHTIHLIAALNQNDESISGGDFYLPGGQPYKNMQTAWYRYQAEEIPFKVSVLVMNLGFEGGNPETKVARNYYMQTFGTNLSYLYNGWRFSASGYYQSGKTKGNKCISAFMANAEVGYKFNNQLTLNAGFDYLSGSKQDNSIYTAFNPLYGTHHKFYGTMDYFYASSFINNLTPGLTDSRIELTYKPHKIVIMSLYYHYFTTAIEENGLNPGLGSEVDYQINVNVMKDVVVTGGYSFMLGSKTMDAVKGGVHGRWQDWAWISVNVNTEIFKTKW